MGRAQETVTLSQIAPPRRLTLLLDGSPLNPIQRWLCVLSTGGTLLDGFVIFFFVAMPMIIADFHLGPDVVGIVGAGLVFGAVFEAGLSGPMADHLGRKKLMLADMIFIPPAPVSVHWLPDRQCCSSDNCW